MKKIFTSMVVALMMMVAPAQAQLSWGIQGGLNMSNVSVKEAYDDAGEAIKSRTGFFIGPTVKFTFPIVGLGLDAAALYDQREGKAGDETIKSSSIQIPINVRYGFGLGSLAEIFAFAGPQFGFKLSGDKSWENDAADWTLKSSNLSANIGIGATVLSHLQAKLNYNIALGKTGEMKGTDQYGVLKEVGSAKFNAWQFSLTYFF